MFAAALDLGEHFRCDPARIARFGFRRFGRLFQMYDRHGEIPLEVFSTNYGTMVDRPRPVSVRGTTYFGAKVTFGWAVLRGRCSKS
jgi:hypothetical protein